MEGALSGPIETKCFISFGFNRKNLFLRGRAINLALLDKNLLLRGHCPGRIFEDLR